MTHLITILSSPSYKGFYVVSGPDPSLDGTQIHTVPSGSHPEYDTQTLEPLYESPAEIRGSAQLIPRSKFLGNGIAILNFRLDAFHLDTGDLGSILEPFTSAFFPEDGNNLLIFENIVYDLTQSQTKHEQRIRGVIGQLRAARWVSYASTLVNSRLTNVASSTLKTVIVLITTHAEDGTGYLATSSSCHVKFSKVCIFPHVL